MVSRLSISTFMVDNECETIVSYLMILPMRLYFDDHASTFITGNSTFHELTKHIKVLCPHLRDKLNAFSKMLETILFFLIRKADHPWW